MQSVSTLMDGELDSDEAKREITRLKTDVSYRESWDAYHLIGDALRGSAVDAPGFSARFGKLLSLEPTVLAPHTRFTRKFQIGALSAAASVAAVAVVAWMASAIQPDTSTLAKAPAAQPQTVAVLPAAKTSQPPAPKARFSRGTDAASEHVHEYLLAHQGISPTTAIQGVTPYIRTVSNAGD